MSIQQNESGGNSWIRLSNDEWVRVPDGADPAAYRKVAEAGLKAKSQSKPTRRTGRSGRTSRRRFSASQVLGSFFRQEAKRNKATAKRQDQLKDEADSGNTAEVRFVTAAGRTVVEVF